MLRKIRQNIDESTARFFRLLLWPTAVSLVALAASLVTPLAVRALIDALVTNGRDMPSNISMWEVTTIVLAVLLVSSLLDAALALARGYLVDDKATRFMRGEATRAVEAALYQPFSKMVGQSGRETAHSIGEILYIRDCMAETLGIIARTSLALILYTAVLLWLNMLLTLTILFILFPLQIAIFMFFSRRAAKTAYGAVRQSAEFGASLTSVMLAAETIRSYGFAGRQVASLRALMNDALDRVLRARYAASVHQSLSQFFSRAMEAVLLFAGARAVLSGTMTLGDVIMYRMILTRVLDPLSRFGSNLDRFQRARIQLRQWAALGETRQSPGTEPVQESAHTDSGIIFDQVCVRYENSPQPALDAMDLHIERGEIVFLVGPSGSGKSTVVRLLAGLLTPSSGTIRIAGHAPGAVTDGLRASLVACAFQEPILVPGTIEDNIRCFDPTTPSERVSRAAEIAGMTSFLAKLPQGLQTKVDTAGEALSGGERQRVCVARMIAAEPALMVIDEATSGLQRALEVSVVERLIASMRPDQSLLIVTHREDLARLGTRIVRLDEGRVVQSDRLGGSALVAPRPEPEMVSARGD